MNFNEGMFKIIKVVDGIESDVWCTTEEGARKMVESNPGKYFLPVKKSDFTETEETEKIETEETREKRKYTKRNI